MVIEILSFRQTDVVLLCILIRVQIDFLYIYQWLDNTKSEFQLLCYSLFRSFLLIILENYTVLRLIRCFWAVFQQRNKSMLTEIKVICYSFCFFLNAISVLLFIDFSG